MPRQFKVPPTLAIVISGEVPSDQDQRELARRFRDGDGEARKELATGNVPLVISVASDLARRWHVDPDDAIGAGFLGLLRAIDLYDPDRPERLSTYATWWIRSSVYRMAIADRIIAVPRYIHVAIRRVARGLSPNRPGQRGCLPGRVAAGRRAMVRIPQESDGRRGVVLDFLVSGHQAVTCEAIEAAERATDLARRVAGLDVIDPRLPRMISRRFGIDGDSVWTMNEVGTEFGIGSSRARHLISLGLRALRKSIRDDAWAADMKKNRRHPAGGLHSGDETSRR